MFYRSLSTVLMAVIATNLLVVLLTFCFCYTKIMINAGYKLLALFILFTIFRSALPFALLVNIRLFWPEFISSFVWKLFPPLFEIAGHPVSVWTFFKFAWPTGIAVLFLIYLISYIRARYYITLHAKVITAKEPYATLIDRICRENNKPNLFTIIELPGIEIPMLFGILKPCILIPEHLTLSEQDWYYILRHEASHHFHHDILMKNIIKAITTIYWWNPFCILLNRQTDVILEMRTDDSLTLHNQDAIEDYLRCLIKVSEHSVKTKILPKALTMSLLPGKTSDMIKRLRMMDIYQAKRNRILNIMLAAIALTIYILSYVFIVEAFDNPSELDYTPHSDLGRLMIPAQFITDETCTSSNSYAIQREDGTYDIYYDGYYLDSTDSLEYYFGVPVYTEDDCPF